MWYGEHTGRVEQNKEQVINNLIYRHPPGTECSVLGVFLEYLTSKTKYARHASTRVSH